MAGTFSKANRPKRPGAYFNFVAAEQEPILANTLGTVVVPFTHDWGPSETVVELGSFGEFIAKFGRGADPANSPTNGYRLVFGAFQGEGLPGRGGAGKVLAVRMTGSAAAKASHGFSNGSTTALTLQARYEGTYGNRLNVTIEPNAKNPSTTDDLVVFDDTVEVERFSYAKTDIAALAADINANSDWVSTTGAVTSGTALTAVSSADLTGGNDGTTLAAGDWTAMMTAVEPQRFSLMGTDLTDSSILASLLAWSQNLNDNGKRFMTVVGGAAGESASTAVARAAALDDPNFVTVGIGTYDDEKFGATSTAQLAPRVAGILARRGESEALTFARLAGLSITVGASESGIIDAIEGGVVAVARDSHPTAPVRLEKGVTTFTDTGDANRPYTIYSVPKFVRTIHSIETELTEFAEINVIGRMPVNEGTRQYLRGQMESRLAAREAAGSIQPGWTVEVDQDPPPTPEDDFVALRYQFKFGRSLEQVLNTVVIG